jgi:hypothetical protein
VTNLTGIVGTDPNGQQFHRIIGIFGGSGGTSLLDPAKITASGVTDSTGLLFTSPTSPAPNYSEVGTVTGHTTGKFHFEFQVLSSGPFGFPVNSGVGISNAAGISSTSFFGDSHTNSIALFVTPGAGFFFNNSGLGGAFLTVAQYDWIAVEVDIGAKLIWGRNITELSDWNLNGSANPATGTGGYSFSVINSGPYYVGGIFFGADSSGLFFNFGQQAYQITPSSGFGNW